MTDAKPPGGIGPQTAEHFQFDMSEFSDKLDAAADQIAVWGVTIEFGKHLRFSRICTHFLPNLIDWREDQIETILSENIPDTLLQSLKSNPRNDDPIFHFALQTARPFQLSQLPQLMSMSLRQKAHFNNHVAPLGDGFVVPVFGPQARNGYSCFIGASEFIEAIDSIAPLQWFAQTAHLRVCETMIKSSVKLESLSAREKEILTLIARGRSSNEISTQLEISVHSVNTYVRRCFVKLSVDDRTSAAIVAHSRGMLY